MNKLLQTQLTFQDLLEILKKAQDLQLEELQHLQSDLKIPKEADCLEDYDEALEELGPEFDVDVDDPEYPYNMEEYSEDSIKPTSEDLQALDLLTLDQARDRQLIDEPCCICFKTYQEFPDEAIRELPCTHVFHKSCVDIWLKEKARCPKCKFDIRECI